MPTTRRPKGMPVQVTPSSPYPELDDWLSVTPKEREWVAEDLSYGKLPGDDERRNELMAAPGSEVETIKQDRSGFLERNPNYTYENKKASKTDLYLKPIGQGIVDTAKDMGRIGADLLFRGKTPTMDEILGRKKAPSAPSVGRSPQDAPPTASLPDLAPAPQPVPKPAMPKPSLGTAPSGAPVNAPPNPKKPAISTTPARTIEVPDLVPTAKGTPQFGATSRKRTLLTPEEEDHFQSWYQKTAKNLGINKNPDDPGHKYDYRAFWRSGGTVAPDPTDLDDTGKPRMHFSSKFKDDDHPNRFVMQDGKVLDSKTDQLIPSQQFMATATKQQKANLERHMVEAGLDFDGMAQPALPDLSRMMPGGADIADMRDQIQAKQLMEQQQGTAPNPTASMIQQKPLSYGEAYAEAGKSFARSAGTTSGAVMKGIGRWAKEIDDHMGGEKKPLNDYATYKLGQNMSKWSQEVFRGRPDLQKNFLLTTLFEAGGSSVPFLAAGAGAAAIGAGPGTTAALTGALASSDSMVEQAPATATDDQKRIGLMLGAGLGLTEGIPISDLFRRIDLASGGTLTTAVKTGTIQAVEESVQEWVQQVGENAVKKYLYGMLGQDLTEGAGEGAAAGGIVGFLTGFMLSGRGRTRAAAEAGKEDNWKPKEEPTPPPSEPPASTIPDLGEVPQKVKERTKPAKVGDAVNRAVQGIAGKVDVPPLDVQPGGQSKLIKKTPGKQEVVLEGTYGKEVVDVTPLEKLDLKEETTSKAPEPVPMDDDMREAMDQDLDFLEEDPDQKPASKEVEQEAKSPLPDYLKENIDQEYERAKKLGVVDKILDMAADGKVAIEIEQELKKQGVPIDRDLIRGVRAHEGAPPADQEGFVEWAAEHKAKRQQAKKVVPELAPSRAEVAPSRAEVAPEAKAIKAEEIQDLVGNLGKGIADGMHKAMFEKVQQGETKESGQESVYLQAAKPVYEAGGIEDVEDMKAFTAEVHAITSSGLKGEERNDAIRKVMAEWIPKAEATEEAPKVEAKAETPDLAPVAKEEEPTTAEAPSVPDLEPAKPVDTEEQVYADKFDDGQYGSHIGSLSGGNRRQLLVDPSGGYFWGDHKSSNKRDVGRVSIGEHKDYIPASFPSLKEARSAGAQTPQSKKAPASPPVETTKVQALEAMPDNQLPTDAKADRNEQAVPTLEAPTVQVGDAAFKEGEKVSFEKNGKTLTGTIKSYFGEDELDIQVDQIAKPGGVPVLRREVVKLTNPTLQRLDTKSLFTPEETPKKTTPDLSSLESPDLRARRKLDELKDEFDAAGKMEVTDATRPQLQALVDKTGAWPHVPGSNLALQLNRERDALRKRLEQPAVPSMELPKGELISKPIFGGKELTIPALDSPKSSAPAPGSSVAESVNVAEAVTAFYAANTPEEKQQQVERVSQALKDFKANPGKINRADYDTRRKFLENTLAKMNADEETPAAVPSLDRPKSITAKAPWEMTRAEFIDEVRNGRDFKQLGVNPTPLKTLRGAKDFTSIDEQAGRHHDAKVTMAFAEGRPVPPEVLADYPTLIKQDKTTAPPDLTPPERNVSQPQPDRDTIQTTPSLEGGPYERTEQPRVDAARPSESAPTQPVPSLEAERPAQQVPPRQAGVDQRATDVPRTERPAAARSEGDAEGRDLPAERGGRADDRGNPDAVQRPGEPARADFQLTPDFDVPTGQKTKYRANVDAIKLLKQIETEGRLATPEEQATLAKYTGWGGIPQAFQWSHDWQKEYRELQDALTDDEYTAARASTPNAHYTDPETIRAIYTGLEHLGFKHGRVLEPGAGVGHFFGVMPAGMARKSQRTAVELDAISARITKQLYQHANVMQGAYQEQVLPNDFFDVAVGNVPFADVRPHDKHNADLNKLNLSLHDYYFAKAISQVRPGGLVSFITSRYTMDKINGKLRDYLTKHADLVGAIRLPNTQFKAIANTDVTTDIIVLRKRAEGEAPGGEAWGKTGEQSTAEGPAVINEYFVRHPENIMGKLALQGSMYRDKEITVSPDGRNVGASMIEAFRRMPANSYQPRTKPASTTPRGLLEALQASDDVKEGAYTIQNNALYVRRGSQFVPVEEASPTDIERAKGLIGIREQVKAVLKSQLEDTGEPFMAAQRKDLNKVYDRFQKKFGYINNATNKRLFRDDPDYGTLQSLEKDYDRKKDTAKKADIFSKRIIEYRPRAEKADTAKEAMLVSLNETGQLDLERMEGLTGRPQKDLLQELKGLVYQDPQGSEWQPAERYLAGNVRQKLKVAEAAAKVDTRFQENVDALKLAIPEDLKPEQISVKLGHGWIPTDVYRDFIAHLLDASIYSVKVNYSAAIGAFSLQTKGVSSVKNTKTFGTDRAPALSILEASLASQLPTVYDKTMDDKRIVNEKETLLAREKQQAIQDEFRKWLWADADRATMLAAKYNEEYNNVRLQDYDGSHLTLPGSNPLITLRPHQKNGVWRALQEGNTLLAHEVGAGKTYTKIAIAMEARRLRMANKPLLTVPNHLVEYWRNAFLELYPAAKVLAATKEDFETANRKKLVGKIATGDWDAVVIAHSQMSRIPMSYESFEKFATEQMDILENYLIEMKADKGGNRNIIKELEKAKARFKSKLESRKSALESNADGGVTFEQTGVDMILVDEADLFKNLWFPTRMTRVAGLPNTESQRSYDMFLKTNYLNQITGQRAVIFGTATPVSNSMAEVFTMQRYLQPKQLEEAGLAHFDAWARQFGNTVTSMELAADGSGYRPKTRFAEFVNVPELTQMFRRVMDVKTGEDLKLPVPKLRTGKPINVTVPASDAQKTYAASLIERAAKLKGGQVDPREDNMLKITGDGRNAALDVRLRVPGAPEDKKGKVAVMVKQVVKEYKDSTAVKGTQLIFLDLSTPKAESNKKKGADEDTPVDTDVELGEESSLRGSVYQDIKRKLLAAGIPEAEVKFIHDAKTDDQKTKLFADVNAGTVRVLIGSTEKMGAGTNVQKKMVALHNLDAPWRPRDIHQRNGRGVRQGNELYQKDPEGFEFAVFNYATEAPTFDAFMWQTLEAKAKTITQIMKGDPNIRTIQDVDTAVMSFAEMKAIASGNPMVMEKANKDIELRKWSLLKSAHNDTQREIAYQLKRIPDEIAFQKAHAERVAALEKIAAANPADPFSIKLDATYTDKTAAGEAVIKMGQDALATNPHRDQILSYPGVGTYRGFPVSMLVNVDGSIYFKLGEGGLIRTSDFKVDEVKPENVMTRFDNAISNLDNSAAVSNKTIATLEKKKADLLDEQKKPFEGDAKIKELAARIQEIDNALDLTKRDEQVIAADQGSDTSPLGILKSERGSIPVSMLTGRREPAQPGFTSSDPDIEARVRAAKQGIQKVGLKDKVKESLAHVWRLVSREFEHLPDTAEFSRLRNDLLKLAKYKGIAADAIQRDLAAIVKPLNRQQYDQLEWKALLEDLKHEAQAEHKLPFGYTAEKVNDDLANLDEAIGRDPIVQAAWGKRQALWTRLKRDYQGAMDRIGFDVSKKLTKENYFRHQVLTHARERNLKGTGAQIRTPTGRGFLKTRHGSSADINANYIQAEFEVMAQMVYDTQLAKVIGGVDQSLNIQKRLAAEAKTQNNASLQAIIDRGDERGQLADKALKDFRKRLGMHMSRIRRAMNLSPDERLSLPQIAEIAEDVENEAHLSARGVFKVINERKAFVADLLGPEKVSWEDLVPETHDLWQPREGNIFYMVDSIPAQLAKAMQESMLEEAGLPVSQLRKVLAMGAAREQYVIPVEAKATLDQLSQKEHSWFVEANRAVVRHWKTLMLSAPRRVIRYIARNTTGDADAMFVGNPAAFKKLPRAAKELLPVIFKEDVLDGEVKEWVQRGGYGTTMQFQELGNLNELKAFKLTLDKASQGGVLGLPLKAWNGYWQGARMSIDYMETMRRYAAYLSYLEQMQENNGVPKNFGASKKATVMALPDIRDRAFKLSNELLGAYDRVSVAGQTLRDFWVLFYSWMEVNATRYGRLVGNALDGGHGGTVLGRGALVTGKNAAGFMIRLTFFWSMLQAWNYLMFDDDEEELRKTNPTVANRPHILFGRDEEGKIQYLAGVGALGDLLSWFGLDSFPGLVGDIMHDRIPVGEAILNVAKAPVNKLWQGLNPAVKIVPEMFAKETSYPDVFHWRPIQDRGEYLGRQTTFGPEINALMGKPGKPLYGLEDLSGLIVQRADPKSDAYFSWQTTERKHLERMGKESSTIFWRTPRGEALHNWASALRYKDTEAEQVWKDRYIQLEKEKYGRGYSEAKLYKDIEKSLRSKAPLSGMSKDDRDTVVQQLDKEELETLKRAEDYYEEVIMQILPAARRSSMQRKLQSQGWLSKPTRRVPSSAGTETVTGLFP